jgi:hypothetical protein
MCDSGTPDFSNYTLATFNQTLLNDPTLCTPCTCPTIIDGFQLASTQYYPTVAGNALFAGIFVALLLCQLIFGVRFRTWGYLIGMTGGLLLEIIGYGARIGMRYNMFTNGYFIM